MGDVFHPTLRCSGCQSGALLAAAGNETAAEVLASHLAIPTADSYRSARNATIGARPLSLLARTRVVFIGNEDRNFQRDRKSTRLNSSHVKISYAVFCLK